MDTALGIRIVLEFTRFPFIWIFPSHKVILKECISVLQSSLSDPNIVPQMLPIFLSENFDHVYLVTTNN